jgi:hypothetical protein
LNEIEIDYNAKIIEETEKINILEEKMNTTNKQLNEIIKNKNIFEYVSGDIKIDIKIKKEYEVCILISHIDEIKNQKGNIIKKEYDEKTFDSKINVV